MCAVTGDVRPHTTKGKAERVPLFFPPPGSGHWPDLLYDSLKNQQKKKFVSAQRSKFVKSSGRCITQLAKMSMAAVFMSRNLVSSNDVHLSL